MKGPLPTTLHPGNLQLQLEKGTEHFTRVHLFFFNPWMGMGAILCTFLSFTLPCQQKLTRDWLFQMTVWMMTCEWNIVYLLIIIIIIIGLFYFFIWGFFERWYLFWLVFKLEISYNRVYNNNILKDFGFFLF